MQLNRSFNSEPQELFPGWNRLPQPRRRRAGADQASAAIGVTPRFILAGSKPLSKTRTSSLAGVMKGLASRQIIVQGVWLSSRQAVRNLAHDLDDVPHHVTASASGNFAQQVPNRRPDFRLGVAGVTKIPIELVRHNQANPSYNFSKKGPSQC
jgi:hypothetical protein